MNGSQPTLVTNLRGLVSRGLYAQGSKSEREAVFLETDSGRYVLRRKTGPVYGDMELEQYVGRQVICDGFSCRYNASSGADPSSGRKFLKWSVVQPDVPDWSYATHGFARPHLIESQWVFFPRSR